MAGIVQPVGKDGQDESAGWQAYSAFLQRNVMSAAANAQVNLTIAQRAGHNICISGIAWSYNDDPTNGRMWITIGAQTVFDIDITQSGPGFFPFVPPIESQGEVQIHLAAAGAGVIGKLSLLGRWTRRRN